MTYAAAVDDLKLLRRHEPILRFNKVELFLPADVGAYVEACSVWEREADGSDRMLAEPGETDLDGLAQLGRDRASRTMHLRYVHTPLTRREYRNWHKAGNGPTMRQASRFMRVGVIARLIDALFRITLLFRGRVPRGAVAAGEITYRDHIAGNGTPYYGRVVHEAGWTVLQYWFFYCMNDWRSSFHGINDHEADWEMVNLYLSPDATGDLTTKWVAFSSHDAEGDALRRRVDDPDLEWVGHHVVAYPGAGSHSHSPIRTDELVRVDPPILRTPIRWARRALRAVTPWTDVSEIDEGLGIPFVDYHRGDGVSIGPGGDHEWQPVVIDDTTPWVRDFRGRWGLDTRDPFGGESAPTGPKHDRDGIDRVRWEDPLGWAGMQKVDPDPAAAARSVDIRAHDVRDRMAEIDALVDEQRVAARREGIEAHVMMGDSATAEIAQARRTAVTAREEAINALRVERRHLEAESAALQAAADRGLPPEGPRAHLGNDVDQGEDPQSRVRHRVLRIWAAVSTPLLITLIIWLLVGNSSSYYAVGVIAGITLLVGIEALARGRLLAFLVTALALVATILIIGGLVQQWRLTLAILLAIGAVVLLWQNLRELRSG